MAPSPASLLEIYTAHRLSLPSFVGVDEHMSSLKHPLLDAIRGLDIMDDYGGEAWLEKIDRICDRIAALFLFHEVEWKSTLLKLEKEGFVPKAQRKLSAKSSRSTQGFEERLRRADIDRTLISPLRMWFEGKNVKELVKVIVANMDFPSDLKSKEVILNDQGQ